MIVDFTLLKESLFTSENMFLIAMALVWMIVAVIQDFKHREVENWWSFSLIVTALVYRAFVSINNLDYRYFMWGLIGLGVGFILCNAFYYGRVFAGGDAKLLMALGVIIPFSLNWQYNLIFVMAFLIFMLFAGAVYGFIYSVVLTFMNLREFKHEFFKQFKKYKKLAIIVSVCGLIAVLAFYFYGLYSIAIISCILVIMPVLLIYSKAIEEVNMKRFVDVKDLTVGDWIAVSLKVHGKTIKPNWEGLSEEELKFIVKNYHKKVLVKYGIPFTPAFLLGFISMLIFLYVGFIIF